MCLGTFRITGLKARKRKNAYSIMTLFFSHNRLISRVLWLCFRLFCWLYFLILSYIQPFVVIFMYVGVKCHLYSLENSVIFWQIPDETVLTVNFFRLANLLYMLSILLSLFPNVVILKLLQWTYTVKLELFSKGTFHCIVVWVVWVAGVVFTLWLT